MRRYMVIFLTVLLAVGAAQPCVWAQQNSVRDEIQSLFNGTAAAFDRRDVEGIAATAMPNAMMESVDGSSISINEWKMDSQKQFTDIAMMTSDFRVENAEANGNSANATYMETHDYTLISDPGHRYRSISRWTVTLTKTPQGWKVSGFKELSEEATKDGIPIVSQSGKQKF